MHFFTFQPLKLCVTLTYLLLFFIPISPYFLVENSWPFCQLCFLAEEIIFITQRELPGYTKKYENSPCKEFNSLGVYL